MDYKGYEITETDQGFLTDVPGCKDKYFESEERAMREIDEWEKRQGFFEKVLQNQYDINVDFDWVDSLD